MINYKCSSSKQDILNIGILHQILHYLHFVVVTEQKLNWTDPINAMVTRIVMSLFCSVEDLHPGSMDHCSISKVHQECILFGTIYLGE